MKDKKGFTLVELLAVIAILAILVIIALPNVLKMFREAKVNTFTSEVQNIMRSAESKYVSLSIGNKNTNCFDSSTNALNLDGRSNILYVVKFNDKGKIIEVRARDEANELIANNSTGIEREDIGKKYKVSEAKSQILDCKGNLLVDGEKVLYTEIELNGTDPVLKAPMIPVMLSNTGVVTYADVYKDEWYKYTEKKWANAVILVDKPSNPNYKEGDTIAESDIRAYFVWIPKYSYRIFNLGNYEGLESSKPESQIKEIEIEFGTRTTVNDEIKKECASPMISGETGDCDIGDLMTHPAFLSIPSNGFWVGKFETGYNQNLDITAPITDANISTWTTANAQVTEGYKSSLENKIIIKPNVYSWRNQSVSTFFQSTFNFNRNLDSHMMKNTEWGAVAYLSHSKYGINDEVRINNNSNSLTGYAANSKDASEGKTNNSKWNTETGYTASTTGNITGIYDMSGVTSEYMASYIDENPKDSGMDDIITNEIYNKYLDKYSKSSNETSYKYRILGDATGEMGPFYKEVYNISTWHADYAYFVELSFPWFSRGGNYTNTTIAGQFNFSRDTGTAFELRSTRLVLTPTK